MKNTYTIAQRNAIVEEHLYCIDTVIRKNSVLIRKAHLEQEDVYQDLALRLIDAVINFDPDKDELERYIYAQLADEMRCCRQSHRFYGIAGLPTGRKVACFAEP